MARIGGLGSGWKLLGALGGAAWLTQTLLRMGRRYELSGKVVLIAGGSRGLGLALGREFGARGARVALCARDDAELEAARADLAQRGVDAFAAPCDVTDPAQVRHLVARVREEFGEIDVLVNNAGVIEVGPVETMTVEDFDEAMQTHFYGPLYTTLEVLPELRRRRDGRIVNISSIGGKIAVPHLLPYAASKFALTGFSEGLRAELARENVFVTTVCPGLMRTGSPRHAWFKGHPLREYAWFASGEALPLLAMNTDRAARKIARACVQGRAELVLTPQAKLAIRVKELFPETTSDLMQLTARLLPKPDGGTRERTEGADLELPRGGSFLTRLNRYAAHRYNEYAR